MKLYAELFHPDAFFYTGVVLLGFILVRTVSKVDDRSLAAACLFIFTPVYFFQQALGQEVVSPRFSLLLFFFLFHTLGLLSVAYGVFKILNIGQQNRRLLLLNTLVAGFFWLQILQPFMGLPAQSGGILNALKFYNLILLSGVGIYLIGDQERFVSNLLRVFKTPLLYAGMLGLLFAGLKFPLPYAALDVFHKIQVACLPLGLLAVGVLLGRYVFFWEAAAYAGMFPSVLLCGVLRLVVSPLLAWMILRLMGIVDAGLQRALILMAGCPTGIMAGVLVSCYGRPNDKRFTVFCILISTLISLATLPILVEIVNRRFPM